MIYRYFIPICFVAFATVAGCSSGNERIFSPTVQPAAPITMAPPPVIAAPPHIAAVPLEPCKSEACKRECVDTNPHKPQWCKFHNDPRGSKP